MENSMKRLPGVIISTVLLIFGAVLQVVGAAAMGFGGYLEQHHATPANPSVPAPPAWLPFFSYGLATIGLGLAAWGITTSVGLFRLRRWARFSTLIIGGLLVFFGVPGMLIMIVMAVISLPAPSGIDPAQAHTMQIVSRIAFAGMTFIYALVSGIGIWWLVYFNRKTVRESFNGTAAPLITPRRPVLISILAVLKIIGVPICALMAFLPIPMALFGVIVHGWGKTAILLAFAALAGVCGIGLWRLQEWGRRTAITFECVGLVNILSFMFRANVLQSYQGEVNRSMNVQQSAHLPEHFQSIIQLAGFGIGFVVLLAILAILHYYRGAFKQPSHPASAEPALTS
jgi:hypothetical protein